MITLHAMGSGQGSITLPDANFGNTSNDEISLNLKKAMDGTIYTYVKVKSPGEVKLTFDWTLTRVKLLELQSFFTADVIANPLLLIDSNGVVWDVILITNPITIRMESRGDLGQNDIRGELGSVTLEFRGRLLP